MVFLEDLLEGADDATDSLTSQAPNIIDDFSNNGFVVASTPTADGTGLPSSKINNFRTASFKRNIIHWFVPEFGVIKMYVNPASITYNNKKDINKQRTKGGYTLQYWGEDLTTLNLTGTTGSSGIEGINVLEEIYRAEQFAFDSVGLSLAANNSATAAANRIVSGIGNSVGNVVGTAVGGTLGGDVGGLLGAAVAQGILGTDNSNSLAPRNLPSLASLAFSIEMFYSGVVYRGFFESMTVNERADNIGLFEYNINFTATQKRGYRFNTFPWQRSATSGPSNNDQAGGVPLSFQKLDR